jgi:hypothetical protein
LIFEKLKWKPSRPLKEGMTVLYKWIDEQIKSKNHVSASLHQTTK